jgi:hypothetical protein
MISPRKSPFVLRNRASMPNDSTVVSTEADKASRNPKEMERKSKLKGLAKSGNSLENSFSSVGSNSKPGTKSGNSFSLESSFSSVGSKYKPETTKESNEKTIKKKLTNDKKVMESLHASYGSLGTGSFSSLKNLEGNDDSDEEFATPRQSLTSPSKSSWKSKKIHQNNPHGSPIQKKIMTPPISPLPVQAYSHRERMHKESSCHDSNSSLSHSASYEEFSTPRQSPMKALQRKKTKIPNPKDPRHVKTIFLQDCSDSSDSETKTNFKRKDPKETKTVVPNKKAKNKTIIDGLSNNEGNKFLSSRDCSSQTTLAGNTKTSKTQSRGNQVSKKKSKSPKGYGKLHVKAANRIAALIRGHIERMKFKLRCLQLQLDNMEKRTICEIEDIYVENEILKEEWWKKAHDRYQKNMQRLDRSLTVSEAHDLIQKIRTENADFRERNKLLFEDVQKLKINNERLEAANKASKEFMDRIVYHEDSCIAEHVKLVKIHSQYEKAVKEHEEH